MTFLPRQVRKREIAYFLNDRLSALGMHTKLFPVEEDRVNIFAHFNSSPQILLSTHMDTVPAFIPSSRNQDRIFGRGACDAKGSLASMLAAVLSLNEALRPNVGLYFVVGEETDSIGAKAAITHDLKAQYLINGEPTHNKLARAQKGTIIFRLIAKGKAGHSGYPEHGDSAIHRLIKQLKKLQVVDWGYDENLGNATLNIGKISGGEASNVIADFASADCCLRVVTSCALAEKQLHDHFISGIDSKIISRGEPLQLFLPDGFASTAVHFGSDATYFSKFFSKVLMAGPGDILKAHRPEESIKISELYDAVDVYKRVIHKLSN